jgi:DNA-binding transcriptional regulator of glucitol operon
MFLAPRWLLGHLTVAIIAVTMVLLGRWQLDVSNARHFDLQNSGYAVQWWAFTVFTIVMWVRILRDIARRSREDPVAEISSAADTPAEEPRAYRRYVMPQSSTSPPVAVDGEHAAYNDYLARLAKADADVAR